MSAAVAAAAAAALSRRGSSSTATRSVQYCPSISMSVGSPPLVSRYEIQKRRDWNNFRQYLRSHCPTLRLAGCSGANVVDFLCYLDGFGQTKVHAATCRNSGHHCTADLMYCGCPTGQPWTTLVALISRLRVAFEENGGNPVTNPFNAVAVKVYLNGVKDSQNGSRGIDRS